MERAGGGVVTVEEIESLISQLHGVVSAKIVVNDWGAIAEIHVLATSERNPKQMVRDVESCLAAKWGLNIDHKKVSVAQLATAEVPPPPLRLKPVNISVTTDAVSKRIRAQVALARTDDERFSCEGTAEAPLARSHATRALCQATVAALNKAIDPRYSLMLEDASILRLGNRNVLVVSLTLINPKGTEENLIGAVSMRHESSDAGVKATLDAVNRRIARIALRPATAGDLGRVVGLGQAAAASDHVKAGGETFEDDS